MIALHELWSTARRGLADLCPTRRLAQSAITLLVLALTAFAVHPAEAISREAINASLRATVQVIMPDNDFEIFALGSGTIMNDTGLILTNHHVVEGDARNGYMNDDALAAIAVTPSNLRGEAVIKYYATVVKTDENLDLALLQITSLSDDPDVPLPDNLGLSPIARGNSDELQIGDEINFYGFPGLGGNSVTFTAGKVSGFLDEDRDGVFEWIKTDGELNHGNSGGLATNEAGEFVGVPSAGVTDDTGKISLVRDGNLALAFVDSYFPGPVNRNGGSVTNVQFAEAVTRRGQPINPALEFPAGITDLYAVFDYAGFEDGAELNYVWYTDGREIANDSFAWDGGESGSSWVNVFNDNGLGNGMTELELSYNGETVYRGGVMVGEGPTPTPTPRPQDRTFSDIRFAKVDDNGNYGDFAETFSDIYEVVGVFDYSGMSNGLEWGYAWFYEGQDVADNQLIWDSDEEGSFELYLSHPDGLPAGNFDLEVYVEGETVQTGSFTVQEGENPPGDVGVVGTIVDRNNNRTTVSGALVVFLRPGVSVRQWVDADFDDSMVHGTANSNRRGEFQLSARVVPGEFYSIVVVHDDYEPVAVDEYQIPPDATDPYELYVEMDRS